MYDPIVRIDLGWALEIIRFIVHGLRVLISLRYAGKSSLPLDDLDLLAVGLIAAEAIILTVIFTKSDSVAADGQIYNTPRIFQLPHPPKAILFQTPVPTTTKKTGANTHSSFFCFRSWLKSFTK